MADQADVETALVSLAANALYPEGSGGAAAIGRACFVYRGVPVASVLAGAAASGAVHVSVQGLAGGMRNVTRFARVWQSAMPVPAALSAVVSGQSVTFRGEGGAGQLAGVAVNGAAYAYAVQASDTPATVASNIAAILRAAGYIVLYAGATLTVPQGHGLAARVVAGGVSLLELRRQIQQFSIALWCADPQSRDAAAGAIDETLAGVGFFPLADGAAARLAFVRSEASDEAQDAGLFRRLLIYDAEYPTTRSAADTAMLFGRAQLGDGGIFTESLNG